LDLNFGTIILLYESQTIGRYSTGLAITYTNHGIATRYRCISHSTYSIPAVFPANRFPFCDFPAYIFISLYTVFPQDYHGHFPMQVSNVCMYVCTDVKVLLSCIVIFLLCAVDLPVRIAYTSLWILSCRADIMGYDSDY